MSWAFCLFQTILLVRYSASKVRAQGAEERDLLKAVDVETELADATILERKDGLIQSSHLTKSESMRRCDQPRVVESEETRAVKSDEEDATHASSKGVR